MNFAFEWDENKAAENLKKHKVSFDEAKTVFGDPLSLTIHDPDHSLEEARFIDIGQSLQGKLLVVVYTERENKIRIISVRKATSAEKEYYENKP